MEKKLMRERCLTRHDVGREEFVNEVSLALNPCLLKSVSSESFTEFEP